VKVFMVTVSKEFEVPVLAEDEFKAEKLALYNADDESDNSGQEYHVLRSREVKSINAVDRDMRDAIPYTERSLDVDEEKTIAELLDAE